MSSYEKKKKKNMVVVHIHIYAVGYGGGGGGGDKKNENLYKWDRLEKRNTLFKTPTAAYLYLTDFGQWFEIFADTEQHKNVLTSNQGEHVIFQNKT